MKKVHRFIVEYKKTGNKIEINDSEIIHQIRDVLKLRTGEECNISSEDGVEHNCRISDLASSRIVLEVNNTAINNKEPEKMVILYLAILKKENFELVLQKASEMGINKIVPIITERTVKTNLNFERLNKIAREASELSGRSNVTKIDNITDFEKAILNDANENKILFDITGQEFKNSTDKKISIYVGPEGGFTDKEIELAKKHNMQIVNLGKLTLRGETAGIIASYLALN